MKPLNKEKLELLASIIEKQKHNTTDEGNPRDAEDGFTMVCITHHCGTPACIAGYAYTLALNDVTEEGREYCEDNRNPYNVTSSWLNDTLGPDGRTVGDYEMLLPLFEPRTHVGKKRIYTEDWYDITPAQAAKVIRHLAATDEIDWSIIIEEDAATEQE